LDEAMTPDQLSDALAARQFGAIGRAQALACGHTRTSIAVRLGSGRWDKVHRGIYVVAGSPDTWERRAMAAQLLAGPRGCLSHLSAAYLHGISELHPLRIDISTPRQVAGDGLRAHRRLLSRPDFMRFSPFVMTTPARTLLDLASVLDGDRLEDCFEESLHRRLVDVPTLNRWLSQVGYQGRRGAGHLRRLLELRDPSLLPTDTCFETLLLRVAQGWTAITSATGTRLR
jgi:putative AbiEi antitoxin of type IV toxin-antitoxin system